MAQVASQEFKDWFSAKLPGLKILAETILQEGQQHAPLLLVVSDDEQAKVGIVPMHIFFNLGTTGKDLAAQLHIETAHKTDVRCAIMVNEVWTLSQPVTKEEMGKIRADMTKSLEHHPDRAEAILWNCRSHDYQLLAMATIDRKTNRLGEIKVTDPNAPETFSHGRMIDGVPDLNA